MWVLFCCCPMLPYPASPALVPLLTLAHTLLAASISSCHCPASCDFLTAAPCCPFPPPFPLLSPTPHLGPHPLGRLHPLLPLPHQLSLPRCCPMLTYPASLSAPVSPYFSPWTRPFWPPPSLPAAAPSAEPPLLPPCAASPLRPAPVASQAAGQGRCSVGQ